MFVPTILYKQKANAEQEVAGRFTQGSAAARSCNVRQKDKKGPEPKTCSKFCEKKNLVLKKMSAPTCNVCRNSFVRINHPPPPPPGMHITKGVGPARSPRPPRPHTPTLVTKKITIFGDKKSDLRLAILGGPQPVHIHGREGVFGFGFEGPYTIGLPVGLHPTLPVESGHRRAGCGRAYPRRPGMMCGVCGRRALCTLLAFPASARRALRFVALRCATSPWACATMWWVVCHLAMSFVPSCGGLQRGCSIEAALGNRLQLQQLASCCRNTAGAAPPPPPPGP